MVAVAKTKTAGPAGEPIADLNAKINEAMAEHVEALRQQKYVPLSLRPAERTIYRERAAASVRDAERRVAEFEAQLDALTGGDPPSAA